MNQFNYCTPDCVVEDLNLEGVVCASGTNEGFTDGGSYTWE